MLLAQSLRLPTAMPPTSRRPLQRRQGLQRGQRPAAAAAGSTGGEPPASAEQQQQQPEQQPAKPRQAAFDIVSGSRVQEEGPSCDWPRAEDQRRLQEAALMTTGFPVPAGYGSANLPPPPGSGMLWRLRNPPRPESAAAAGGRRAAFSAGMAGGGDLGAPVLPVFRAAPYSAEAARQRRASPTARILFLDDGCTCRAVLAQALMQAMLKKLAAPGLDVEVHAASIGPPVPGGHDERVVEVCRDLDIPLQPRRAWEFDEMRDTVDYDLVLVMDQYDRQEVVREVSVLERLNPGGAYLTRIHCLNSFARAGRLVFKDRCLLVPEDVPDPFYGVIGAAKEQVALRRTVQACVLGCRGLLSYLLKLRARCGTGPSAVPLRTALAQSLQCPLMDPTSHHALSALIHCQLAPAQLALWQEGQAAAQLQVAAQQLQLGKPSGQARGPKAGAAAAAAAAAAADAAPANWATHVTGWPRPIWVEDPGTSSDEDGAEGSARSAGSGSRSAGPQPLWTVRDIGGSMVVVRRPRPDDPASRHGYWVSPDNVERELRKWMERQGMRERLPTQQELRRSGANTLSARVDHHGGLAVFAERMGLPLASGRMRNGHWADFETLSRELRKFVAQRQHATAAAPVQAPQALQRQQAGRQARAPAPPTAAPRRQQFASGSWSASEGVALQQPGMAAAAAAVTLLGEDGTPASVSSAAAAPDPPLMFLPTQQELRAGGRADLIGGIRQHGGSLAVARRLGWAVHHGRLPSEAVVVQNLLEFAARQASQAGSARRPRSALLEMPTLRQLEEGGRADLAGAVERLGGVAAFKALLEAEQRARLAASKAASSAAAGEAPQAEQQQQPQAQQQQQQQQETQRLHLRQLTPAAGASHILRYPSLTGGAAASSSGSGSSGSRRRAAAPEPPQPAVVQVALAVEQLIAARGWERRVPTKQELLAAGRRDLHVAITRCGGAQKLAEHLQLPYTETRGRRKRSQAAAPAAPDAPRGQGQAAAPALQLQPGFLAARLRQPPGRLVDVAAASAVAAARAQLPVAKVPQGPASRLLERELVEDAYTDFTLV